MYHLDMDAPVEQVRPDAARVEPSKQIRGNKPAVKGSKHGLHLPLKLNLLLDRLRIPEPIPPQDESKPRVLTVDQLARERGGGFEGLKESTSRLNRTEQDPPLQTTENGEPMNLMRVEERSVNGVTERTEIWESDPFEVYYLPRIEGGEVRLETTPISRLTPPKERGFFGMVAEGGKLLLGKATRGDIVKHIQEVGRDPEAYKEELTRQLAQAFVESTAIEEKGYLGRHHKVQAILAPIAAIMPYGLPFPPYAYSTGSLITTSMNIWNSFDALLHGKFRKSAAYFAMTGIGIVTGVAPVLHNFTSTFYAEFLQRRYDQAETHNTLNTIAHMPDGALKQEIITRALQEYGDTTGKKTDQASVLEELGQKLDMHRNMYGHKKVPKQNQTEEQPATGLFAEHDMLVRRYARLNHTWRRPFRQILHAFPKAWLKSRQFLLNDAAIDINHKIHSIPQLTRIVGALAPQQQEPVVDQVALVD